MRRGLSKGLNVKVRGVASAVLSRHTAVSANSQTYDALSTSWCIASPLFKKRYSGSKRLSQRPRRRRSCLKSGYIRREPLFRLHLGNGGVDQTQHLRQDATTAGPVMHRLHKSPLKVRTRLPPMKSTSTTIMVWKQIPRCVQSI